ncbi:hypothetical protein CDD82_225 [Ophiocordyceps australis]|uniref:Fibroin-3 n=1 Tax=Ophiocordyceps australis TaxID=1399860 RepID=A0A2C5YH78_9HYPO|nr:hypothetical protein CDD82_225 [Ophiocordyceps australis]
MPSIDVAMVASRRDGTLHQVSNALRRRSAPTLSQRDLLVDAADRVYSVKKAFSSWDNCMKATFCKWPVIALIIVGSLILIGILWCIIRCACCGLSCCCSCCRCFKCCGNCCGCCDAPGQRKHKYLDEPYVPPNHGYQPNAPMQPPFASAPAKQPVFEPPQYAQFDVSKKPGDDSLPQMPSWEGGSSKHVLLDHDEVEMTDLNKPPPSNSSLATPSPGLTTNVAAEAQSPMGYMPSRNPQAMSPGRPSPDYNHHNYGPYGPSSPQEYDNLSSAYGYAPQQSYGNFNDMSNSAQDPYSRPYAQPSRPPAEMPSEALYSRGRAPDEYGTAWQGPDSPTGTYGQLSHDAAYPSRHAALPDHDMRFESPRAAPTPHGQSRYDDTGYASSRDHLRDAYSSASARAPEAVWQNNAPYAQSPPESPITNNAGFDFTSGYARPPTRQGASNESQWSPPSQAYPGYKPYQRF